jgi:peroxiredoxin
MILVIKNFYRWFICVALTLFGQAAVAQISYVQKAIEKLEGYDNFSYKYNYKQKEYTADTLLIRHKDVFQKAPEDKTYGYLFSLETLMEPNEFPRTEYYNGKTILSVYPGDSTYYTREVEPSIISQSLIGHLYWIRNFLKKKPTHIVRVADTTTNGIDSYHFVINNRDTIINKEHYYSRMHLFIDKLSKLPASIVARAKYENPNGEPTYYYSETRYFDFKVNQGNVDIASIRIPVGYHLPKAAPALLTPGTIAPDWTLLATTGKKVSLSQLKGKVVLMDFYFIGCHNCMDALASLNNLYKKYKNQQFVIASITGRDNLKSVLAFDKSHHIKYPGYVNGADVVKSYHVDGFPTFYFIDREGKVAHVALGYDKDFEANATSIINALLKK